MICVLAMPSPAIPNRRTFVFVRSVAATAGLLCVCSGLNISAHYATARPQRPPPLLQKQAAGALALVRMLVHVVMILVVVLHRGGTPLTTRGDGHADAELEAAG